MKNDLPHRQKCGKLKGSPSKKANLGPAPSATITLIQKGDTISVKIEFTPPANSVGPLHPTHRMAMAMIKAYTEKQEEGA